ncbi:hypothetical protein Rhal01_03166 [Rubritalea halochordaticola]|uniref:Band 7 domain-containing protein n=1 Tax=Rubritalea halochordaticola TaxID=714537 RepID=A0ABP9V336_9BACT
MNLIPITIREGERVMGWKPDGSYRIIEGPKRLWFEDYVRMEKVMRYHAEPHQYLKIRYLSGEVEHRPGPCVEWENPVLIEQIDILKAKELNAHEAFVVYQKTNGKVERRVELGPLMYYPQPNEWLHEFSWHGAKPGEKDARKYPSMLQFQKLRVIPDQMYFDIENVRTTDEALITVKVMVFFELADINKMLDQTHDPIADFINALTADVVAFVAQGNFAAFKENTAALNELETYQQLVTRAKRIGYEISKVVYRGYAAAPKLQAMHDNAIEIRTKLTLEAETEAQAQNLADLRMKRDHERNQQERQEETRQTEQRLALAEREQTADIQRKTEIWKAKVEQEREEHAAKLKQEEERGRLKLEQEREEYAIQIDAENRKLQAQQDKFRIMTELGIDLTQVLVAENQVTDKLIRLEKVDTPEVHLHEAV